LLFSYFIISLNKEILTYWNIYDVKHNHFKRLFSAEIKFKFRRGFSTWHTKREKFHYLKHKFIKNYEPSIIRNLERNTYMYHIGASIGTATFSSICIIIIARVIDSINQVEINLLDNIYFIFLLILITLVCLWYNHNKIYEFNEHLDYLEENLPF
jgi:hypothetical protein